MGSFYNTTNLTGKELFDSENRVKTQEEIVLGIFKEIEEATPFEIQDLLVTNGKIYPITSVRRALTNLTKLGKLEKTTTKRRGAYGQLNYTWRLKLTSNI